MAKSPEPVVLELASLPREQMGPFLILGVDKSADKTEIERHWADRVKWGRRNLLKLPLEDVNWAREMLSEPDKRIKADTASLNSDTTDGTLAALARRYGLGKGGGRRLWQPLDSEKDLADYSPAAEVPSIASVRDSLAVPPLPEDVPAVAVLVAMHVRAPLDPWAVELG